MKQIRHNLQKLITSFKIKEEQDRELNKAIRKALAEVFSKEENPESLLRDFYVRNEILFLETRNKVLANELFFKKEELFRIIHTSISGKIIKSLRIK